MTWVVQREVSAVDGGVVTCEGSPPRQGSLGPNLGSPTHYELCDPVSGLISCVLVSSNT